MSIKVVFEGYDEFENKNTVFVDSDGKIRTGIVEYIKLIAQHTSFGSITVGTSTTTPTTYNTILCYPLPFHSNVVGDDYKESTLSATAAVDKSASKTGSVTQTFVANLRNAIRKVRGDVVIVVTYTYASDNGAATTTVRSITIEFGKIDTSSGSKTILGSKTINVGHSVSNSTITESVAVIFQDQEFEINEGERIYLTVTINYSLSVAAPGSLGLGNTAITATATVRIDYYRGTDDTHILLPVVM